METTDHQHAERVVVADVGARVGDRVKVCGWVEVLRLQSKMQFVVLRDETGSVQITSQRDAIPELADQIDTLTLGSSVAFTGTVVAAPQVKLGGVEVLVESMDDVSIAEPLPISADSGPDLRSDWRFLDLRTPRQHIVFKVWDTLEQSLRSFFRDQRFTELHTPKLMPAASESGASVFRVEYFGTSAFLAQSPQFYKQMAIAAGFDRVLEVGPVFRAEPSFTSRHATEFTGLDLEMAWIDSHADVMAIEAEALAHTLAAVKDAHGAEIKEIFGVEVVVPSLPFPSITLGEAREQLLQAGWRPGESTDVDLDGNGERMISQIIHEKLGHQFVFLTEYPVSVRPFYHMRTPEDPTLTRSFDLIWNGLEVTTGAQREHRYDVLAAQAHEKGIPLDSVSDYVNCFRYGCPPHGGLGMGLNRLVMKLLDLASIRDAALFFRGPNRLTP